MTRGPAQPAVQTLILWPDGPEFPIPDLVKPSTSVRVLHIGSDPDNEIVVHGKYVADVHCLLRVTGDKVEVGEAGHPTFANGMEVTDGYVALHPDSRVKLGKKGQTYLVAGDGMTRPRPQMVARDMYELVQQSPALYGNVNRAAKAFDIPPSTFYQWVTTHKFKVVAPLAVLLAVAGGALAWHQDDQGTPAPAMAPALPATAIPTPGASSDESPETAVAGDQDSNQIGPAETTRSPSVQRRKRTRKALKTETVEGSREHETTTGIGSSAVDPDQRKTQQATQPDSNSGTYIIKRGFTGASFSVDGDTLIPIPAASQEEKQ